MDNKAQLTLNSMNSISSGTLLYEKGDSVDSIGLLVKGRVEAVAGGVCTVLASGNFLGICDVERGVHQFTYTAKDDAVVFVLPVNGLDSVRKLLIAKPEYCGLLVTSLNFFITELYKRQNQLKGECQKLNEFILQNYELCEEVGKGNDVDVETGNPREKLERYSGEEIALNDRTEYYLHCGKLPIEVQKKYFSGSDYIALFHFQEQCLVIRSLVKACSFHGNNLFKYFRSLIMDEDSVFNTMGRLALAMLKKGAKNSLLDRAVDEVVEKINETETYLIEKAGLEIELDRERMEKLYFALLSGDATGGEESEDFETPGVEFLYDSLEQITEYATVHLKVKSEFKENIEKFIKLKDKFEKTPETTALRKQITSGFFEIYEAVVLRSFGDRDIPLAVKLFLDYGFVSEKLLTEEELQTLLSLRREKYKKENGCRVYTMRKWLKAVYDGVKEASKNEYDMDYEETLRQMVKEKRLEKKDVPDELANKEKRMHFECQNLFRYADRVVSGNISAFVPVLCSDGIFGNISNSYVTEAKVNAAVEKLEEVDYSIFYRDRLAAYEEIDVMKVTVIDRIPPDVITFPVYGKNCIMWQDITGKRRSSKGRILIPILFEKDLEMELVRALAAFRWEKCRTDMGNRWNDFRYPSLTSEYTDYLQFYRKNSELTQERKTKIRAQLQQCNNKHKEVFVKDYMDWVLREARGAMKLSRVARNILFTYCPLSSGIYKNLEGQTVYAEAAKKYIRENRAARKNLDMLIHKFEKEGIEIPEEVQKTSEFLKG